MTCDRLLAGAILGLMLFATSCWSSSTTTRPHEEERGGGHGGNDDVAVNAAGDMIGLGPAILLRRVVADPFALDRTEVTADMYRACLKAGACTKPVDDPRAYTIDAPGAGDLPINGVSRDQAAQYCAWAGKRLPTGEEWVWAARGQHEARPYPWGSEPPSCDRLHLVQLADAERLGCAPGGRAPGIAPVGSRPAGASRDGLLDMAGNVGEWTSSDKGPGVALIGTWDAQVGLMWERQDKRSHMIGFRCAASRPPIDVAGTIGRDGVLVADVDVRDGDPWPADYEDVDHGCDLGGGGGVLGTRVRRAASAPSDVVPVFAWDGKKYPPDQNRKVPVSIAAGSIVPASAQVTLVVPDAAYYVTTTTNCPVPGTWQVSGSMVALNRGDIVYAQIGWEGNATCSSSGARWRCNEGWLTGFAEDSLNDYDDDETRRARPCFASALKPVKLRAPSNAKLGWWIRVAEGWIHAESGFDLEVQCDECTPRVFDCFDQLRCQTEACETKCRKLHEKCESSWTRYPDLSHLGSTAAPRGQ